jgi:glycosyltransferase involved in cell wall biosynthesis
MDKKIKIVRIATTPGALRTLLKGQLNFISENGYEVIGVSVPNEVLDDVAEREGIRTLGIKMSRSISLINDLISLISFYRLCKKEKPDIVHSITPKAGLIGMLGAKIAGVPIRMHTFTGLIFPSKKGLLRYILIKIDQLLCWAATNIYPEGDGVKQDLINYKITKKQLNIIANGNINGVNLQYFNTEFISNKEKSNLKTKLGISENDFIYLYVGRITRDKGINELIQAFTMIKQENIKNIKLIMVGNYDQKHNTIRNSIYETMRQDKDIILTGFQKDVRPYYVIADLFTFPSYREGFPNVVLQANAMELPCLVTNINGSNEIIEEGVNGTIIPIKDVHSLKAAMITMLGNRGLLNNMKQNCRKVVVDKYDQNIVWEALIKEYKTLLTTDIHS